MKSSHDLRLQKQQNKQQCKDMDETDLFFLSMSKAIKKLPKLEQSKIKLDLHSAISQAEIRLLEAQNQVRKTPINVTHHIISPPQQQKLQSDVHTSTSMLSYPRRGATQLSWSRSSTTCSTVSTTPAPTTSTGKKTAHCRLTGLGSPQFLGEGYRDMSTATERCLLFGT